MQPPANEALVARAGIDASIEGTVRQRNPTGLDANVVLQHVAVAPRSDTLQRATAVPEHVLLSLVRRPHEHAGLGNRLP